MSSRIDPDAIGFLINDVARLLRMEFDRRTASIGLGLTPAEARTLVHVARWGASRQAVLAERMGVEAMTLSACLDRLQERGLVCRAPDPADRRAKLVSVTEAAWPVLDEIARLSRGLRADMSETFTPEAWRQLGDGLKHIRERLRAMRPECGRKESTS